MSVEAAFGVLESLLAGQKLACEHGPARYATADEFMWMGRHDRVDLFKHRDSRNYVWVTDDGELVVPFTKNAFNRGYFDRN